MYVREVTALKSVFFFFMKYAKPIMTKSEI